ncbi:hypothetical protein SeLEV6574_g05767 [Synchytrium endobioticum]|uniref:NADH-ubiquinone oxidoreductase 78 kDa subunit, mitochondrial n=1 Tax=Synchytrium endobioticum TaxID=286115 RepID=A0A507CSG7_9FUNG|nr:hypothetical protein SeLEV6574_g05767 [Synchytrium endobioticum]
MHSVLSIRALAHRLSARSFSTALPRRAEIEVFIDGKGVKIEAGSALIQACEKAGVDIPRFCYHERLSVAGNCRMCLVELEKSPKPVASCAMPAMPGMKVKTNTPMVKKAREGVMEFLLANHPLDCPVCDQGGECDLQDQSVRYGSDRSRFAEPDGKRAVEDKDLGPLVKTVMTRCIHCTRCVRFSNEVAGATEMGSSGRGNDIQIGTYVEKTLNTEMSGNIIDLCPVGALTSKPYAFTSRPWELKKTESIDVLDAVGCNIRVDSRGLEVMRVVPRLNDDINEEWIADKTRFAYDGLKRQRLTTPLVKKGDEFVPASWPEALEKISDGLQNVDGSQIMGVAGQLADAESLVALKDFLNKVGCENLRLDARNFDKLPSGLADLRPSYTFNTTIANVDTIDALLLIGTNPRHEAPIINARIRKAWLNNELEVGLVGAAPPKLNYDYDHISDDPSGLAGLIDGSHPFFEKLRKAKKPMIMVGSAVLEREDAAAVLGHVAKLTEKLKANLLTTDWNGLAILQRVSIRFMAASYTAALDIGFLPSAESTSKRPKFIYLLNADDIRPSDMSADAFVVYQGHHGDNGALYADVILPGSAYTEKSTTYVNTEGRTQTTRAAVPAPAGARDDWKIIRALSEVVGVPLPYDTLSEVRDRMGDVAPGLLVYDTVQSSVFTGLALKQMLNAARSSSGSTEGAFELPVKDYYLSDPISRASSTMARCSQAFTYNQYKPKYSSEWAIAV